MMWISIAVLVATLILVYRYVSSLPDRKTRQLFVGALLAKLVAAVALGLIYQYFYDGGDSRLYFSEARKMDTLCRAGGVSLYHLLSGHEAADGIYQELQFRNQPAALFFNKFVYLIYQFSWGNFWVISAYLALLSFSGFWMFYRCLVRHYALAATTLVVAFFLWPSVLFWSSGLVKESLSVPLILASVSCTIYLVKRSPRSAFYLVLLVAFGILLFKIKYYYAAVLIPVLVSWYLAERIKRHSKTIDQRPYLQGLTFLLMMGAMTGLASQLHFNLRIGNVLQVMVNNYYLFEAKSAPEKMVTFPGLSPDFASLAYYAPKALFSGLFRPLFFEGKNIWSLVSGLENTLLLLLALLQVKNIRNISKTHFLILFAMLFYCAALAILLTWSSPNFGTLVRYKAGFMPIFLLLVLEKNPAITFLLNKAKAILNRRGSKT